MYLRIQLSDTEPGEILYLSEASWCNVMIDRSWQSYTQPLSPIVSGDDPS